MRALIVVAVWVVVGGAAAAHPAPFSYLDLRLTSTGIDGSLTVHDFDVAHDFGIDPPDRLHDPSVVAGLRDGLTALMDRRLVLRLDGQRAAVTWPDAEPLPERQSVRLTFRVDTTRPGRVQVDAILFPYDPIHQTFVNVYEDGTLRWQAILNAGDASTEYFAGTWQGARAVMAVFIPSGIEHILIGPDHVLFLIGLMLLGGSLWRLTTIVTAFTIGHSITLSLAALDVLSPPATLIEPAIALSIVFVGADNLLVQRERSRQPRDIRPWVAGVFGLVHGFGFASVLKAFGLPGSALGWSLFSFNLGVEIGQLAIVLGAAWILAAIRRRSETTARLLVIGGSVLVIAAGAYWFVERVFFNTAV